MRKVISIIAVCLVAMPAFAAQPARGRNSVAGQIIAAPRQTASVNQLHSGLGTAKPSNTGPSAKLEPTVKPDVPADDKPSDDKPADVTPSEPSQPEVDRREKEKAACINNNIGVGNTFVWASRYGNTGNYASMIEDIDNPANNTCFVRVDIRSSDSRINVSDFPSKYFEWGSNIVCGSWIDEAKLKQRILDAKKSARTWGTVAGAVGGAGLGVGIMELFGNRIIGGKVMGQKALKGTELIRSQMLTLKQKEPEKYRRFIEYVRVLKTECEQDVWNGITTVAEGLPEGCTFDFDTLLSSEAK